MEIMLENLEQMVVSKINMVINKERLNLMDKLKINMEIRLGV